MQLLLIEWREKYYSYEGNHTISERMFAARHIHANHHIPFRV